MQDAPLRTNDSEPVSSSSAPAESQRLPVGGGNSGASDSFSVGGSYCRVTCEPCSDAPADRGRRAEADPPTSTAEEMRTYNEQRANGFVRVGSSYLFGSGN